MSSSSARTRVAPMPFLDALGLAHTLRLVSSREWKLWWKNGMHPDSLPSCPDKVYKDRGWEGWGHWLGTGNTRHMRLFLPFEEALVVARSLRLPGRMEWKMWSKEGLRPANVPAMPDRVYKDHGWQGWGHWLGTGNQRTKLFLPFAEALVVARSLGLHSSAEWRVWSKVGARPANVPSNPNKIYKDHGWQGWGHWLGSSNLADKLFLPFKEALLVAQSHGLTNHKEWCAWSKEGLRPANVPSNPNKIYKDHGWQGWGHWLGSRNQSTKLFLSFKEALVVARSLRLSGKMEWRAWSKEGTRPPDVPSNPDKVYKDHRWQGWGHWLGTGNTQPGTEQFLPFGEALAVVRSLNLASQKEWEVWSKAGTRPANVPAAPSKVYKDRGWQAWGHWLGTGNTAGGQQATHFLPFNEALVVARSLRLHGRLEWQAWSREGLRPSNVPSHPNTVYKDHGWQGWATGCCPCAPATKSPFRRSRHARTKPSTNERHPQQRAAEAR